MTYLMDVYYHVCGKDQLMNTRHSHNNCIEIIQICSGRGHVLMKNRIYPMRPGTVFVINAIDVHCTNPDVPNDYIRNKVAVHDSYFVRAAELLGLYEYINDNIIKTGGMCIIPQNHNAEALDTFFLRLCECGEADNYDIHIKKGTLYIQLLAELFSNIGNDSKIGSTKISEIMSYINSNISSVITLDDICKRFYISKSSLCHSFKAITNMTVMEYILKSRIAAAKKKLLYTDMPISEIALNTGFSSFSLFSRSFKRIEGCTPSEMRKGRK